MPTFISIHRRSNETKMRQRSMSAKFHPPPSVSFGRMRASVAAVAAVAFCAVAVRLSRRRLTKLRTGFKLEMASGLREALVVQRELEARYSEQSHELARVHAAGHEVAAKATEAAETSAQALELLAAQAAALAAAQAAAKAEELEAQLETAQSALEAMNRAQRGVGRLGLAVPPPPDGLVPTAGWTRCVAAMQAVDAGYAKWVRL